MEFLLVLNGFRREEMDRFLRFGELDAQTSEFLLEPVKPLVHFRAKLLHFGLKLVGGVLDFRPKLAAHLVDLGADFAGKQF